MSGYEYKTINKEDVLAELQREAGVADLKTIGAQQSVQLQVNCASVELDLEQAKILRAMDTVLVDGSDKTATAEFDGYLKSLRKNAKEMQVMAEAARNLTDIDASLFVREFLSERLTSLEKDHVVAIEMRDNREKYESAIDLPEPAKAQWLVMELEAALEAVSAKLQKVEKKIKANELQKDS